MASINGLQMVVTGIILQVTLEIAELEVLWSDSWLITKVSAATATATTKNKNKEQRINMGLVVGFGLVVWVKTYNLRC